MTLPALAGFLAGREQRGEIGNFRGASVVLREKT
jgi:hypothetical protein